MGLLEGKKALIFGVANERSIAWWITKALKEQGASVALSYLNENLQKRVEPLAEEVGADFTFEMDVTNDDHYEQAKNIVKEKDPEEKDPKEKIPKEKIPKEKVSKLFFGFQFNFFIVWNNMFPLVLCKLVDSLRLVD